MAYPPSVDVAKGGEVGGSTGRDETTIGGTYGELVVGGVDFGAGTKALGELGGAIVGGLVADISDTVHDAVNGNGLPFHAATPENASR